MAKESAPMEGSTYQLLLDTVHRSYLPVSSDIWKAFGDNQPRVALDCLKKKSPELFGRDYQLEGKPNEKNPVRPDGSYGLFFRIESDNSSRRTAQQKFDLVFNHFRSLLMLAQNKLELDAHLYHRQRILDDIEDVSTEAVITDIMKEAGFDFLDIWKFESPYNMRNKSNAGIFGTDRKLAEPVLRIIPTMDSRKIARTLKAFIVLADDLEANPKYVSVLVKYAKERQILRAYRRSTIYDFEKDPDLPRTINGMRQTIYHYHKDLGNDAEKRAKVLEKVLVERAKEVLIKNRKPHKK